MSDTRQPNLETRVVLKNTNRRGTVRGHAFQQRGDSLHAMVIVVLDEGAYLAGPQEDVFVSSLVVHQDNIILETDYNPA